VQTILDGGVPMLLVRGQLSDLVSGTNAEEFLARFPQVEFIKPCNLCPHMKRITLPKILDSLVELRDEVTIDPLVADKARRAVERMINLRS